MALSSVLSNIAAKRRASASQLKDYLDGNYKAEPSLPWNARSRRFSDLARCPS